MSTAATAASPRYYTRFTRAQSALHATLMITFLGLAATGLTPASVRQPCRSLCPRGGRIPGHPVFAQVVRGGINDRIPEPRRRHSASRRRQETVGTLKGPNSLVPNRKDVRDFLAYMKWFLFLGAWPTFLTWYTYWEKVDYWSVFWGMAIIGISGYAMWFAPTFARLVPGSWLNVALLVHGEREALLAVSFIFVNHFSTSTCGRTTSPWTSRFYGLPTEEDFKHQHLEEYQRLEASGALRRCARGCSAGFGEFMVACRRLGGDFHRDCIAHSDDMDAAEGLICDSARLGEANDRSKIPKTHQKRRHKHEDGFDDICLCRWFPCVS